MRSDNVNTQDLLQKLFFNPLLLSKSEIVQLQDVVANVFTNPLLLNILENISVVDFIQSLFVAFKTLTIQKVESITLSDVVAALISLIPESHTVIYKDAPEVIYYRDLPLDYIFKNAPSVCRVS